MKIILLMGMSCCGKDSVMKRLINKGFKPIISFTDRPMRKGEQEGVEYYFETKKGMDYLINNDKLIEYREYHTLVNNISDVWRYGVPKFELDDNYVGIVDVDGAKAIIDYFGKDNVSTYCLYSDENEIKERCIKRGDYNEYEFKRRIKSDKESFSKERVESVGGIWIKNNDIENVVVEILGYENEVWIDFDGVIGASIDGICKVLNKKYNVNVNPKDIVSWNFSCSYPDMTDEEVEEIFKSDDFFDSLTFINGADGFLSRHRNNCIIITKGGLDNIYQKRKWLDKMGFRDIEIIGLPLNISKGIINMQNGLFIDDSTNNLNESNAKYKYQFKEYNDNAKREWQINWNGDIITKWN